MLTHIEKTYSLTLLKEQLKKYDDLMCEAARHKQFAAELEQQEKELIAGTDINDKKHFRAIGDIRLKREIAPRKVLEFEAAAEKYLPIIEGACDFLISTLLFILDAKMDEVWGRFYNCFLPFFKGRENDAKYHASNVLDATNMANHVCPIRNILKGDQLKLLSPILKAQEILKLSPQVLVIQVDTEIIRPPSRVKSAELLEDMELERFTKDPESAIADKVANGLNRETAEEAVRGRIEHLKREQKRRGIAKR